MSFAIFNITNLQEKSNTSPRKCSMNRIILNSRIPDLLKKIDPLGDLAKQIHEDDGLPTLSCVSPSFLDTLFLWLLSEFEKIRQDVELVGIAEVDVLSVFATHLSCCSCPKVISLVKGAKLVESRREGRSDVLTWSAVRPVLVPYCRS